MVSHHTGQGDAGPLPAAAQRISIPAAARAQGDAQHEQLRDQPQVRRALWYGGRAMCGNTMPYADMPRVIGILGARPLLGYSEFLCTCVCDTLHG